MKTKEEILKAAQQNQDTASFKGRKRDDERAQAIRYQSFRTAWIAGVIALIAFSVLTMLNDQPGEHVRGARHHGGHRAVDPILQAQGTPHMLRRHRHDTVHPVVQRHDRAHDAGHALPRLDLPLMEAAMESQLVLINHLRELRTARHLSQKELAQMVGVSRQTINSIENTQYNPTAKLALLLCIALDCKFEDLFAFE